MKPKAIVVALTTLACSPIYGMDGHMDDDCESFENHIPRAQKARFKQDYANRIQNDYHSLFTYLRKYVDLESNYTKFRISSMGNWIETMTFGDDPHTKSKSYDDQPEPGRNIVCLYYFVRNYLRKAAPDCTKANVLLQSADFSQNLFTIILCLQAVAFDIIQHYITYRDPSVLYQATLTTAPNAYTIFKMKFHHLLTTCMPRGSDFKNYPNLHDVVTSTIQYWHEKQWYNHQHSCDWVKTFQWAYPCRKGAWGIWFGATPKGKNTTADILQSIGISVSAMETDAQSQKIFSLVAAIFASKFESVQNDNSNQSSTVIVRQNYASWEDFFKEFTFPITQEMLDKEFPLLD